MTHAITSPNTDFTSWFTLYEQLFLNTCCCAQYHMSLIQGDTKKPRTFEKSNKNWRNSRKKNIDKNWTITTSLLRDGNPNYQCLKSTSCRWRPPPRMHSFAATTHFKSSRSFVSSCVCSMLWRMRQRTPSTVRNFQT